MPSMPLIASSSGVATVSAITLGLAPGYVARTTMDGGTTSGYSEIGSPRSAIRPAIRISSDSTPAKIGRSMKNLDGFISASLVFGVGCGLHVDHFRLHDRAVPHALQSIHDDALTGLEAALHHAQAVDRSGERDLAVCGLVGGA